MNSLSVLSGGKGRRRGRDELYLCLLEGIDRAWIGIGSGQGSLS